MSAARTNCFGIRGKTTETQGRHTSTHGVTKVSIYLFLDSNRGFFHRPSRILSPASETE